MQETNWKAIAIQRRLENKQLKKRCKELIKSRDEWKNKALIRQQSINTLEKQSSDIKKNLLRIIKD